jgi:Fe-S oxidoreductase
MLEILRRSTRASLCLECGKCSSLCPLASFGAFTASRLMAMHEPREEAGIEAVARCLTCASCEVRCPQQVRFTDYVLGLREHIPAAARLPCPHGELLAAAARLGAARDLPAAAAPPVRDLGWLGDDLEIAAEGEIGLFVGCLPIFDVLFRQELGLEMVTIARAAIRILNRLGVAPVLVAEERCCGHDLLWHGEVETFRALAEANARAFAARGVKTVLTACAECCRTWRRDYPEVVADYRPKVQHLAEHLAEKAAAGALAFRSGADGDGIAVTYQDPCRLGRHLGVIDEPRRLLDALPGTRRVEMERAGRDALCCGTSGFTRCDALSRQLQAQRLAAAAATGAGTLLTACPKCLIHFACAQAEDRRRGRTSPHTTHSIRLEDLTVFLAAHLGAPVAGAGGEVS